MSGFKHSCVLAVLAELDLATLVLQNGNKLGAVSIAKQSRCDARCMETVLDALAAMGYFIKKGSGEMAQYAVSEEYIPLLDSRHADTYIPVMRHMANVQRSWTRLSWTVRDGKAPQRQPSILGLEEDDISNFVGMNAVNQRYARETMYGLRKTGVLDFAKENVRILEVGGASCLYTQAFLEALPGSTTTILDRPEGIAWAQQFFAGTEWEPRISYVTGNLGEVTLPGGYDFLWISSVIQQLERQQCRALFAKAFGALQPGGLVVVRDYVMNTQRTSPEDGICYAITMMVYHGGGRVYTFEEIREDLLRAGFVDVCHTLDVPNRSAVVTARRPE